MQCVVSLLVQMKGRMRTQGQSSHQQARKKKSLPEAIPEGIFQPLELWENKFLLFGSASVWQFINGSLTNEYRLFIWNDSGRWPQEC